MSNTPLGRTVIRPLIIALSLIAAACSGSNPAAPSLADVSGLSPSPAASPTPPAPTGSPATVSQVLPATLPPSPTPQTLLVEGENFKPGLTVDLAFTPAVTTTASRLAAVAPATTEGPKVRYLNDRTFELDVTIREEGSFTLRVTNPESAPSPPILVTSAPTESSRPAVAGLSPATPTANPQPVALYVAGTHFESGAIVKVTNPAGSTSALGPDAVAFLSPTLLRVTLLIDAGGRYALRVLNPSGETSEPWAFTVDGDAAPTPAIEALSPASPTTNQGDQSLAVHGDNFVPGLSVILTGPGDATSTITGTSVWDVTPTFFRVSVVLPNAGSYTMRVVNPSGQRSEPKAFTVKAPEVPAVPTISAVDPGSPTQSSTPISLYILGTNFVEGLVVKLTRPNGETTAITGESILGTTATALKMAVTLDAAGVYSVRVVNPSGQASTSKAFTVRALESAAPAIHEFSPGFPVKSGSYQYLYVYGQGFAEGLTVAIVTPGGDTVTIGGSSVLHLTSTSFKVSVLLADIGTYSVRVTNPSGQTSSSKSFIVKAPAESHPPTITQLLPESITASPTPRPLYVQGTHFVSGLVVKLKRPNGETSTISGDAVVIGSATVVQVTVTLAQAGQYQLKVVSPSEQISNVWTFTVASGE